MIRSGPAVATGTTGRVFAGLAARLGSALAASLAAERVRWALWLPVLFGIGIGNYFSLDFEPAVWTGPATFALAAATAALGRRRQGLFILGGAAALMAAGFTAGQVRTALVAAPVVEKRLGPVTVQGRVRIAERRGEGQRLTLDRLEIERLDGARLPETVRLALRQTAPVFRPGDVVRLRAVIYPPPGPAAPGAFDFARRAWFERLGGVGYATGRARRVSAAAPGGMALALERLRQRLTERILAALPGAAGGIAAALMTGERGAIPEDVLAAMRDSGLAHLLAISGLHVGLVGGLVFFFLRLVMAALERPALAFPVKKWAAAAALAAAFAYLLISGATVPTQRAFLMLALVMLAVMIDRQPISMNLVAWAAGAILLAAPESLLSVSFQMSFAAVIALVAAYEAWARRLPGLERRERAWPRPLVYLGTVAVSTLVAGLATAPFAAFHFNRVALYGLIANLVAVPLAALWIMPWALAAFLLMPLGLGGPALDAMGWGIEAVIAVARWISALPGAVALVPAAPTAALVTVALGGLWLCLWRRRWRYLGTVPIAAGFASVALMTPPDLLVDGSGRLFALRGPDGRLALSSERAGLTGETWLRRSGEGTPLPLAALHAAGEGALRCDRLGCIYAAKGFRIALVHDRAALAEDCGRADVVIARVAVTRRLCRGPALVIDRWRLWRDGAHALWLAPGGIRVESVAAARGDRPWSPRWRGRAPRPRFARLNSGG